ncbi:MAG: type IIL restriction-modification enzyme MmeI, partial [Saprospiraceae bacterium]
QMNMKVSDEFGQYFVRLPLNRAAKIVHGNALRLDWRAIRTTSVYDISADQVNIIHVDEAETHYETLNVITKKVNVFSIAGTDAIPERLSILKSSTAPFFDYILGNPPFIGKQMQNEAQKADMDLVFNGVQGSGVLDYVAAWYLKAAQYIQNTSTKVAFVSTNSISQGEQVGIIWGLLFNFYKIKIHFAHRTFSWSNEAKGNAAVHCVIIGFAAFNIGDKRIFDYEQIKGEPTERIVKNINPYLVEGSEKFILSRSKPICNVPEMFKGSQPTDGGNLILTEPEKAEFLKKEPKAAKFLRQFLGSEEFINGNHRWCLWLKNVDPSELRQMPLVSARIEAVKKMRLASTKAATQKWANFPTLFTEERQPNTDYLLIPSVSSENRKYIPIGYLDSSKVVSNLAFALPNASLFLFGLVSSEMHMAWVRQVCGRLESRFRYSNTIVYNNYPFPLNSTNVQKQKVEAAAQAVLDVRAQYPNSSLADLYDPLTMPPDLVKAHQALDKAVDLCYRSQAFTSELNRIEFLFGLYEQYTAPMFGGGEKKGKKNKTTLS